jgi:hypothetical protein
MTRLIILSGWLVISAFAEAAEISGRLIDLGCYWQDHGNTDNHHKDKGLICAQACASEGFPVGLLTRSGKIYQVTGELAAGNNTRLVPNMGKTVTIGGDVDSGGGRATINARTLKVLR